VVLKRLEDAVAEGDTIYAVIRGVGLNNDGGDKASFTAPSVTGQAGAIRMALEHAQLNARSIGYVEAHGTGTALGDPIEIAALT
ncbi:polyketide synthase, partial [Escherichia coli]|nr:polyketide synthase [Escherichia coli]